MKQTIIIILIIGSAISGNGQGLSNIFAQKQTEKKYMILQLAALKVYAGYLQKGYSIAKKGLNTIADLKNGEFSLHKDYFNSLKTVNPKIRNYVLVAEIISLQVDVNSLYRKSIARYKQAGVFNQDELSYQVEVFEHVVNDCINQLDALTLVITNNKLQMKDDERVACIDEIYKDMQDNYAFAKQFSEDNTGIALSRIHFQNDANTMQTFYDVKK